MSLASDTARTASHQTMALTLYWFIKQCEESVDQGRQGLPLSTVLEMINEKLSAFERTRRAAMTDERVRKEREADQFDPEELLRIEQRRKDEAEKAWRLNNPAETAREGAAIVARALLEKEAA